MRSDSAFAGRGYSMTWWCKATIQQAREYCRVAISMARTCSVDTSPRAFVNEKWASAAEFSTMIPNPSSVSGGSTMGKIAAHSWDKDFDSRDDPLSAKATMSSACGFSVSLREGPSRPALVSTTRSRVPCSMPSADMVLT